MSSESFRGFVDHDFNNGANWLPSGPPQAGDVATIVMSSATFSGTLPANLTLSMRTLGFASRYSSLSLQDATIPASSYVYSSTFFDTYEGLLPASLSFSGRIDNKGRLEFDGGTQSIALPSGTTFRNEGTIDVTTAASTFSAATGASLINDGLIRSLNPFAQARQGLTFSLPLSGSGTVGISLGATAEFAGAVGAGQSVAFIGGADAGSTARIDVPSLFAGTVQGFVAGDTIVLANTAGTSATFVAGTAGSGTLNVVSGGTVVASLALEGRYASGDFTVAPSGSALTITTAVTDPTTGSTVAPTTAGLFRFFDDRDGTHFLAASVAERDSVLSQRSDLVAEVNGFGQVTAADAGTVAVYRFFDTIHGTHFFTASAAERDAVVAARPDLTYEASATFLEHGTAQAGDVAVTRLFSTANGTHLYTASAPELSGLLTPGSTSYRADLVSEGVSFYAPSGRYG